MARRVACTAVAAVAAAAAFAAAPACTTTTLDSGDTGGGTVASYDATIADTTPAVADVAATPADGAAPADGAVGATDGSGGPGHTDAGALPDSGGDPDGGELPDGVGNSDDSGTSDAGATPDAAAPDATATDASDDSAMFPVGPEDLPTAPLPLGFWCGPPAGFTTPERYAEVAAAGFTHVMPPCSGPVTPEINAQILDGAQAAGLTAWLSDPRMPVAVSGVADADARLDSIVADYGAHPALAGYFVTDEPAVPSFAGLGEVLAGLRARDPGHPGYVNLLPTYATTDQLGAPDYATYLEAWLAAAQPSVLSYDHYHFLTTGDRPGFFLNLALARQASLAHGVPFWQIVLAIPHLVYRPLTEAEKRWEVMQTLAWGGKGVMFFTYWTPPIEGWGAGLITVDGAQSTQYGEVQAINADAAAIGRYLVPATSVTAFQSGALDVGAAPRRPGDAALVASAAPTSVGVFTSAGDTLILVANRDYTSAATVPVALSGSESPRLLDPDTGAWLSLPLTPTVDGFTQVSLELPPGDGALLWTGHAKPGPLGAEAVVGTVRADAGALFSVDSLYGLVALSPAGWSTCPSGFTLVGLDFQSDGFWLCAREDVAERGFTVGNVVADAGSLWRVQAGETTSLGMAGWGTCPTGALIGTHLDSNGFWLCLDPP